MHGFGVYVKSNLPIARETILEDENEFYICFRLALLHSTTFIFFLYRSPSSSSCPLGRSDHMIVGVDVKFPSRTEQRLTSKEIIAKMVYHAIYNLDASKATGPDRIPAIVLKMCSPELSPVPTKLYNKCLAESCFPSCWKSSLVVPVFKNYGKRSDPG